VSGDAHFGSHQTPNAAIKSGTCHKTKFAPNAPRIRSAGSQKINQRARHLFFYMRLRKGNCGWCFILQEAFAVSGVCLAGAPDQFFFFNLPRAWVFIPKRVARVFPFPLPCEKNILARGKRSSPPAK